MILKAINENWQSEQRKETEDDNPDTEEYFAPKLCQIPSTIFDFPCKVWNGNCAK